MSPLSFIHIIKIKKGLESLHHIYTVFFRREVAIARIGKVRYLGCLEHTQVGGVLGLVFWGLWAWRENVVVGGPSGWGRRVPERHLVVELIAIGCQVVTVVGAVALVDGGTVEIFHLKKGFYDSLFVSIHINRNLKYFITKKYVYK